MNFNGKRRQHQEQIDAVSREMETLQMNQKEMLEIKSVTKMKNGFDWLSSVTLGFPVFKSCIILVGMCSGISLWFKVHFHDVWSQAPLHMLTSHVAIRFPKVSLQAVCPFGYWVVVSLLICKRISKFKTSGASCKESQKEVLQGQPGMLKRAWHWGHTDMCSYPAKLVTTWQCWAYLLIEPQFQHHQNGLTI